MTQNVHPVKTQFQLVKQFVEKFCHVASITALKYAMKAHAIYVMNLSWIYADEQEASEKQDAI